MDSGTAYGRPTPAHNAKLTEVGPGTPGGEWLRRYWHPVALSTDATERPKELRVLGETLVLFRDLAGRTGLMHARCAHRGTTLYYGKVEERGIRCCYHGWLFDVQGHCLEQPCEPAGGQFRSRVRQPWYPVEERYGLVWAYLGPPEKKPLLPRFDVLEELGEGEYLQTDDTSMGTGGPTILHCNWLQHFENVLDSYHVPILHGTFSGTQFVEQMGLMPEVEWQYTDVGVRTIANRMLDDGRTHRRITEVMLPTVRVVASPRVTGYRRVESLGWVLPMDDRTMRIYVVGRVTGPGQLGNKATYNGKPWAELTAEEHQRFPGDTEAQEGQGAITFHSEEHLVGSDKGIGMLRRMMTQQIDAVAQGGDPIGLAFDDNDALVKVSAGNFIVDAPAQ